jgi:S1-C subfamily serine protease
MADVEQTDLPTIVHGVATRAVFAGSEFPIPLREPLIYHGYPLGNHVFAWTDPLNAQGMSEALIASRRHPDLVFRGSVMNSVDRAKRDSETVWRAYRGRMETGRANTAIPSVADAAQLAGSLAFVVSEAVVRGTRRAYPDLAGLFPFGRAWNAEGLRGGGRLVMRVRDRPDLQIPQSEPFLPSDLGVATELLTGERSLAETDSEGWWSPSIFTYVGPYDELPGSRQPVMTAANRWLVDLVVPAVEELNRQRITRVLPEAPMVDASALMAATIVLTSEGDLRQGSAFFLEDTGWVTCAHVVRSDTVAFHFQSERDKYPVATVARDERLDLAILEIPGLTAPALPRGNSETLSVLSPITVAGYPNHNVGDTPMIRPGFVVAKRQSSGLGRFLTSAGIILGMSGGPVVDSAGAVVGVAATGTPTEQSVEWTEFHSFIPIEAIDHLTGRN